MKKILYIFAAMSIISGCEDMKMDRNITHQTTLEK